MSKLIAGGCLLLSVLTLSCTSDIREKGEIGETASVEQSAFLQEQVKPLYTRGFKLTYADQYLLADIRNPQSEESTTFHYTFVKRGVKPTGIPADYTVIELPIRNVICMTSLQLSNFIKLSTLDRAVRITSARHLLDKEMNERLKEGKTAKIGIEGNFDNEAIMSMNPDLILVSPFKRGDYETLKDVGIPLVPHLGYKRTTPLGQAGRIKFVGLLLGIGKGGNGRLAIIERKHNELKELTADGKVKKRPIVFSDELRGGNWYAVGGKSFLTQLFRDAGASYFLKGDERSGGVTLDFKAAYDRADDTDYWRIVNSFPEMFSYEALREQGPHYEDFRAFRKKGIIYYNMENTPFYESMPTEPEIVLTDLLHIFHPDLLPGHESAYYSRLK